jgi:hypothetical protein
MNRDLDVIIERDSEGYALLALGKRNYPARSFNLCLCDLPQEGDPRGIRSAWGWQTA